MMPIPLWTDEKALTAALARNSGLGEFRQEQSTLLFGGDVEDKLSEAGAAAVQVGRGFAGVLCVRGRRVDVLDSDYSVKALPVESLVDSLLESAAGHALAQTDGVLEQCKMLPEQRAAARRAILSEHLRTTPVGTIRRLSLDPAASNRRPFGETGLPAIVAVFLAAHLGEACVWLAIWRLAGQASIAGQLDIGWLWGWTLLFVTLAPLRIWAARSQGTFARRVGGLLKRRRLAGALRPPAGEAAQEGTDRFFSRMAEGEAVETRALSGGLALLVSIVELALASALLTIGANGELLLAVFLAWALLAIAVAWRYACERDRWITARLSSGHDTRQVQEPADRQPKIADDAPGRYHDTSERMDRWSARLNSFGPAGWLLVGVPGLLPAFSGGVSSAKLAIWLGGLLLTYQALRSALNGISKLMAAAISWRSAAPVFRAAEDSRVLLARTLLQKSESPILNESSVAVDQENLRQSSECSIRSAETEMVVAQP